MADVSISLPEELTRGSVETACLDANPQAMYDCAAVRHADGAGLAFLWLLRGQKRLTGTLSAELAKSLEAFDAAQAALPKVTPPPKEPPLVALGRAECDLFARWGEAIAYLGETLWMLIGFLLGLILAFQSAIPLQLFGAESFVGGLVGIALVRELGVLVAAILMAGRTGSAFAAELGAMKVNEEIDSLETMGLRPVRFLVLPRVLAGTLALPLLSLFVTFAGLIGGGTVMGILGFSGNYYLDQLQLFVDLSDVLGSFCKAFAFGFSVSAVGCWCGLRAGRDAGAVGTATTAAVVTGIVSIALLEGLFSVVFYAMGW